MARQVSCWSQQEGSKIFLIIREVKVCIEQKIGEKQPIFHHELQQKFIFVPVHSLKSSVNCKKEFSHVLN
ncbi:hypothetical protein BpHYR1_040173 [Brachionus plicatilis]|uniref:Uncharacterized protein n=1 Tax=Brachionus plicatilis TaxID=10195 RepID=A0A3M7QRB0_BRAPC|nr:hypothetical protein BpHYR1_040173 [Brachionus plicatilis]